MSKIPSTSKSLNSRKNLLKLSREKENFAVAVREWQHSGLVIDYFAAIETCRLCEQSGLRFHYEICNRQTDGVLLVGSSCIHKFEIPVYDDGGEELFGQAKTKRLQDAIKSKHRELLIESFRHLWQKAASERLVIERIVHDYKQRSGFTPANLLETFTMMNDYGVTILPKLFNVVLRSNLDKQQLLNMSERQLDIIWPSLTGSQRKQFSAEQDRRQCQIQEDRLEHANRPGVGDPNSSSHSFMTADQGDCLKDHPIKRASICVPTMPVRFDQRAHKFTITFYDQNSIAIDRMWRGNLEGSRKIIADKVEKLPNCHSANIIMTATGELVESFQKE